MTEAEAKQHWCPFARVAGGRAEQGNRWRVPLEGDLGVRHNVIEAAMCVASACMAWRLIAPGDASRGGYCGLAGPVPL